MRARNVNRTIFWWPNLFELNPFFCDIVVWLIRRTLVVLLELIELNRIVTILWFFSKVQWGVNVFIAGSGGHRKIVLFASHNVSKIDAGRWAERFLGFLNIARNPLPQRKSNTFEELSGFLWIFPRLFPYFHTGKSMKNMMWAGDANRTIFRWSPEPSISFD